MAQPFKPDSSTLTTFNALKGAPLMLPASADVRAVVIGGGTGAPVSIITLLSMGMATNAVVAMADDGGSTGILREEAQVTPPGDIRKCIAAFAKNPEDPMTQAFRYRFEFARNHTLGNLMLSALEEATGSFLEAIDICEKLLDVRGHVFPSTLDSVTLTARTRDGQTLHGQANASRSTCALEEVQLESPHTCRPCGLAIQAIREADLIVLGPGSLFTSIIPNLLVPGIADAIAASKGKTVFVCSLADMQGETWGLSAREHVEALCRHGMAGLLDYVLIHSKAPVLPKGGPDSVSRNADPVPLAVETGVSPALKTGSAAQIRPVKVTSEDIRAIEGQGPVAIVRDLVDAGRPTWHDPHALRAALREVLELCHLPLI